MKRYILSLLAFAALGTTQVVAQTERETDSQGKENYVYVPDAILYIDASNKTGTLEVWLDNETTDFNTYIMDLYLPEGFTITKNSRTGKFNVTANNGDEYDSKTVDHSIAVGEHDGFYRILGASLSSTWILNSDDLLFSVTIQAPEDFSVAETRAAIEGAIRNIEIAAGGADAVTHYFPDVNFAVDLNTQVGVDEIIDGSNALYPEGVYDLQGRRIVTDKLEPGIYIIDGKKVMVK